ncbi:beta-N-acetylhexosaminidase [Bizionia sediminis]|uniref:beta-N-acetylhexosaminidase n=1 Tax=Bizionia sediminis TaxID=1737064 RepID=A0ABW5KSV6_9FLAO
MQLKNGLIYLLTILCIYGCSKPIEKSGNGQIIPIPEQQVFEDGYFTITNQTGIQFDKEFEIAGNFLKDYIHTGSGLALGSGTDIRFTKEPALDTEEAYSLEISATAIEIKAATAQGAFYAVQSLRQLMPAELEDGSYLDKAITISNTRIKDRPVFSYRGMHLDVARHMFPVSFIKKYIDALALLKFNNFHWHLTDDQGWRVEIKRYPKLQEIAAYRNETQIGFFNTKPHQVINETYGGYYTQEEIKELVAYAKARFITIIPEIELPGHALSALAAYPELSCNGTPLQVATTDGVFDDIFCVKAETFRFLEGVFDEIVDLFPGQYIHIGGDAAPKTRWKNCTTCQNTMKEQGLTNTVELQSYFVSKIAQYLHAKGRQIIGWDATLNSKLAPDDIVMTWRGPEGALAPAAKNQDVIVTSKAHTYFNRYQSETPNEPLAFGGYVPLKKVYQFNPLPATLSAQDAGRVLGAQGIVWTQYTVNAEQLEYMVFPRAIGLAEALWSHEKHKNYDNFVSRLSSFHDRLDFLKINYANHLHQLKGHMVTKDKQSIYELQKQTDSTVIRYTLDGSIPNMKSKLYNNGIPITKNSIITAAIFDKTRRLGPLFTETIQWHQAIGKDIILDVQPHHAYPGMGSDGLINGVLGNSNRYRDNEWLGFFGEDVEITIDLDVPTTINAIAMRFHNGKKQLAYAPKKVEIELDNKTIFEIDIPESNESVVPVVFEKNYTTRFITIRIPNFGKIPEGSLGEGSLAWTFIDEIQVN